MGKPDSNLPALMKASGIKYFSLAFVQSQGCVPVWYPSTRVADDVVISKYIDRIRAADGNVIISFGGYDGTDIGQACTDPASLQAAYQTVIDKYKPKILDFDVEHLAIEDSASIDRRNIALKALVAGNPGLQINYTLPATPQGLTNLSMNVINSAVKYGTPVTIVNLMTMDYGVPVPNGAMGVDSVAALGAAWCQIKAAGLNARLGVTPMIGTNDTTTETFTLDDARVVLAYAQANPNIVGLVSFWSVSRDNGGCTAVVSPTCSGIQQNAWDFSRIFAAFQ
jgi:chitinase